MMYEYKAKVDWSVKDPIHDGDNVYLLVDLGFRTYRSENCRLYGIDAAEINSGDRKTEANAAKNFLIEKLGDKSFTIKTRKDKREKFGRMMVEIMLDGETDTVNQQVIAAGHAVPYFGEKKVRK